MHLNKYDIVLNENVQNMLKKYIQKEKNLNEAGGILLGQIKGNTIYILRITVPGESDKASRFRFERNKKAAQQIIDYEFTNSDGKTIYLGEWHTHPEKDPSPSMQDVRMITGQFQLGKLNEDFILLLIQGIESLYVGMYFNKELTAVLVKN